MESTVVPLAERLRPRDFEEFIGQDHIVGNKGILTPYIRKKKIPSMILWGPPGSGKTTLARMLAQYIQGDFVAISAVFCGISDLKKIFDKAKHRKLEEVETMLFVDEIHRFNKAQQDSFLHVVETGIITLIGASTENPGFEINNALLSRMRVYPLYPLDDKSLIAIVKRSELLYKKPLPLEQGALSYILEHADGDGRKLLNYIELIYNAIDTISIHNNEKKKYNVQDITAILGEKILLYDKGGDNHYNLTSALHKSLRGSDCDAALYYLARMLDGGDDPRYIARRLLRFSYEDVGLADREAPLQALYAWQSYERLGSPEGEIALAYLVVYLALAPKSNSIYDGFRKAMIDAKKHGSLTPPKHILNAPTYFAKKLGYGKEYKYDHDEEDAFSGQDYFPTSMGRRKYYIPVERGFERDMKRRLEYFNALRKRKKNYKE